MRVLFLVHDNITLPLGVSYLSAILKAQGHSVTALVTSDGDLEGKARSISPDLIAFGCTTGFHGMYMKAAAGLKKITRAPILMGGSHPTFFPEVLDEHPDLDFAMRGEAEESILQFMDALEGRRAFRDAGNLIYRDGLRRRLTSMLPLVEDLDSIPFPDRALLPGSTIRTPCSSSRGGDALMDVPTVSMKATETFTWVLEACGVGGRWIM